MFERYCGNCGTCCKDGHGYSVTGYENWEERVLIEKSDPMAKEILRVIRDHFNCIPVKEGTSECHFLEKRDDGKYYCRIQELKPQSCKDFPLTGINLSRGVRYLNCSIPEEVIKKALSD